jgi:hypothetical protein
MHHKSCWIWPLLLCAGSATAAPTAEALAAYRQAGERFATRVAEAEASDRLGDKGAQLRDAEFAALVATLSDEGAMLVEGEDSNKEIEADVEICEISNKANISLVLFDIKARVAPSQDQQALATAFNALMVRNVLQFQDEFISLQPFLLRCLAKQMRGLERFVVSLPPEQFNDVRRRGVLGLRKSVPMIFYGGLMGASETVFREDYRDSLLSTLAENADAYAAVIPLSERKKIMEMAARVASSGNARFGVYAAQIEKAFRSEACSAICALE